MRPQLATLLCLLFIAYLFWVDRKRIDGVSNAVWIPFLWMFFAGSRVASQWLDLGPPEQMSAEAYSDGSPLDRNVFAGLMLAGIWVLSRRGLNWGDLVFKNAWVWLFFLFAAISIVWSDDPLVSLKRWVKGCGNLVMALIILTEQRPYEALGFILRRLGFVLIPISVLFVRYYPELGRGYHMGQAVFTGATFSKNSLGQICLIVGIYYCWELIVRRRRASTKARRLHPIYLVMLLPTAYLLYIANCATCSALMVMAICFLLAARSPLLAKQPQRIVVIGTAAVALTALLEYLFEIREHTIRMLGREPDLTTRMPVWEMLLEMAPRPWIGAGYESFWSGERLTAIWTLMGDSSSGIIQAHNGYIETYLNLGIVGLVLLVAGIIVGTAKAIRRLRIDPANAALCMLIIITVVIYNYTEAAYKPLHNMFVLLLIAIVEIPYRAALKGGRAPQLGLARQQLR